MEFKFELDFEEIRTFRHKIFIKAEDKNSDDIDTILDQIEADESITDLDEYEWALQKYGLEVIETQDDKDGDLEQFECNDIEEVNNYEN